MSALKLTQLEPNTTVYMVDFGGTVQEAIVVAVKTRPNAKPQVCILTSAKLDIVEYYDERFFPTPKEAWYAVAMFAQRRAQESMTAAAVAFKKAGIAVGEETTQAVP